MAALQGEGTRPLAARGRDGTPPPPPLSSRSPPNARHGKGRGETAPHPPCRTLRGPGPPRAGHSGTRTPPLTRPPHSAAAPSTHGGHHLARPPWPRLGRPPCWAPATDSTALGQTGSHSAAAVVLPAAQPISRTGYSDRDGLWVRRDSMAPRGRRGGARRRVFDHPLVMEAAGEPAQGAK